MAGAFRRFRLARKVRESDVITSFYFEPLDGARVWQARPGQYLTLKVPRPDRPVLKTYSLSCDVAETSHHRISVKREGRTADDPQIPDGIGSCWLHDQLDVGAEVEIAAPRGTFVLDEDSPRPVVLLAGGVGLTPLLSMLHRLATTERKVWFLHACENGAVHAMGDEVARLAADSNDNITTHFIYRAPTDQDRARAQHHYEGVIEKAVLQSLLPLDDYDFYICGPTPFMVAMFRLLRDLGVHKDRIAYEFFGKATSLEALAARPAPAPRAGSKAPAAIAALAFLTDPDARAIPEDLPVVKGAGRGAAPGSDVYFAKSSIGADWDGTAGSLLELAENAGLAPEFSCRAGICNTCRCRIQEGEVIYFEQPLDPPPTGEVLICCSRPSGRVVLDI